MKRLLYLTHRVPYPPDKGDRIRNFHVLRHLARHARVSLACLTDEPTDHQSGAVLAQHCEQVGMVPVPRLRWLRAGWSLLTGRSASEGAFQARGLQHLLQTWTRQEPFDAVLVSASSMTPYLRLPELDGLPAVVDMVDVDSQKWLDYGTAAWGLRRFLYRWEGRRLRRLEAALPTWTHGVAVVTQTEAELYRRFCRPGPVHVIPNGVDLDYFQPSRRSAQDGCVFIGALDYRPNVDAVCWFVDQVWPGIRQRRPQERLRLVGRRPVSAVTRLAAIPGVDVVGTVADVRPYLAEAALAVAPLRIARGVQNKVLEALAMGKATLVSPQVLAGVAAVPGRQVEVAATVAEWITSAVRLLGDSSRREELGEAGRAFVEERHCWDRCLSPLTDILGLTDEETTPDLADSRLDASGVFSAPGASAYAP